MSFKDKKEEVIEVRLTSFGKHLLSKGELKPVFYAFFDDDVLYDSKYTEFDESQNYAEERILVDTPSVRLQSSYTGLETEVEKQIEQIRSQNGTSKESIKPDSERNYSQSAPLGNSAIYSDFSPSWDISIYGSKFVTEEPQEFSKTSYGTSVIPQMNIKELLFRTYVIDDSERGLVRHSEETDHAEDLDTFQMEYSNGNSVSIDHTDVILEIDELHTEAMHENYDIELFLVEEDSESGEETLSQLSFTKGLYSENKNVIDGILYEEDADDIQTAYLERDETYVEHYLNIDIDTEIDHGVLCKLGYITDFSKRGYIRVDCDKIEEANRMSEIYDIDETDEPFGDDC